MNIDMFVECEPSERGMCTSWQTKASKNRELWNLEHFMNAHLHTEQALQISQTGWASLHNILLEEILAVQAGKITLSCGNTTTNR